tara:strand:+ start:137 stop:1240 length:1104 start_codon:yes stop_codon:yes gene_type:complete
MSLKLSRLKKWLTLEDSAKYLSLLISEDVTTTDLLQLGLQGDLTLSIYLVNSHYAQTGPKVPTREAQLYKISFSKPGEDSKLLGLGKTERVEEKEKNIFLDQLIENDAKNYPRTPNTTGEESESVRKIAKSAAQSPLAGAVLYFKGDALPHYSGVLEFDRENIQQINGLWDLSMVGSESLEIEDLFYGDIDGPGIDWVKLCGVILKHPTANNWANLVERFNDKIKEVTPQDFYPRESIPEREPLVIRRDELQRFANTLNESEIPKPTDQLEALPDDSQEARSGSNNSELRRMQRTLAALAIGLADKHGTYRHGGKPNVKALAETATDHLRDENGRAPHGFSDKTARDAITAALNACPDLLNDSDKAD